MARFRAPNPNPTTPGERVRLLRMQRFVTTAQFAAQVGISVNTLINIEGDHVVPSLPIAFKVARLLGVTVDELYGPYVK